jgi:type II secretory pathway pseudopilin PulG
MNIKHIFGIQKKSKTGSTGFTLAELLVAAGLTGVVLLGVGTGMVNMITANKRAEAQSETRIELNRAQDFITDESRSAQGMWQPGTVPGWWPASTTSGTAATAKLYLQVPLRNIFRISANQIQLPRHGFQNGDAVIFTGITSGLGLTLSSPTAATSTATVYYVVGSTADNFQVASTSGGAALTLTDSTSAIIVPSRLITYYDSNSNAAWLGPRAIHRSTGPCGTTATTQAAQCPMLVDAVAGTNGFTATVTPSTSATSGGRVALALRGQLYDNSMIGAVDDSLGGNSLGVNTDAKARPTTLLQSTNFTNTDGTVTLTRPGTVSYRILGGDIRCGSRAPAMITTATLNFTHPDGTTSSQSAQSNIASTIDVSSLPSGTRITVTGGIPPESSNPNNTCGASLTFNSAGSYPTRQVITLRNGDKVPELTPFGGGRSIDAYLSDYMNLTTRKITIEPNQVIYLFELGTTDGTSGAYDLQDIVVLGTIR